jgi:hypothetical protein
MKPPSAPPDRVSPQRPPAHAPDVLWARGLVRRAGRVVRSAGRVRRLLEAPTWEAGLAPCHWEYGCAVCRKRLPASDADVCRHLRDGFPSCCGGQMVLEYREPPDTLGRPTG